MLKIGKPSCTIIDSMHQISQLLLRTYVQAFKIFCIIFYKIKNIYARISIQILNTFWTDNLTKKIPVRTGTVRTNKVNTLFSFTSMVITSTEYRYAIDVTVIIWDNMFVNIMELYVTDIFSPYVHDISYETVSLL